VLADPAFLPAVGTDRRQDLHGERHRAHPHAVGPPRLVRPGHHDRHDGQPRLQGGVHEPLLEGKQPSVSRSCALREQDERQVVLDHFTSNLFHGLDGGGRVGAVDAQVVGQHVELPEQRVPDDLLFGDPDGAGGGKPHDEEDVQRRGVVADEDSPRAEVLQA